VRSRCVGKNCGAKFGSTVSGESFWTDKKQIERMEWRMKRIGLMIVKRRNVEIVLMIVESVKVMRPGHFGLVEVAKGDDGAL
jgi:hypothetical protein